MLKTIFLNVMANNHLMLPVI